MHVGNMSLPSASMTTACRPLRSTAAASVRRNRMGSGLVAAPRVALPPSVSSRRRAVATAAMMEDANLTTAIIGAAFATIPLSNVSLYFKLKAAERRAEEIGLPPPLDPTFYDEYADNVWMKYGLAGTPLMTKNAFMRYRIMGYECDQLCKANDIDTSDIPPFNVHKTVTRINEQHRMLRKRLEENGIIYDKTFTTCA